MLQESSPKQNVTLSQSNQLTLNFRILDNIKGSLADFEGVKLPTETILISIHKMTKIKRSRFNVHFELIT